MLNQLDTFVNLASKAVTKPVTNGDNMDDMDVSDVPQVSEKDDEAAKSGFFGTTVAEEVGFVFIQQSFLEVSES